MTDREHRLIVFFFSIAIKKWQRELKSILSKYERIHAKYISVMIEHDVAANAYAQRIEKLRQTCKDLGMSDSEIEDLTRWRDD